MCNHLMAQSLNKSIVTNNKTAFMTLLYSFVTNNSTVRKKFY